MIRGTDGGIRSADLEVKFLDRRKTNLLRKHCQECSINQERKLEEEGDQIRPSSTINDASQRSALCSSNDTPGSSGRKPKAFGSGEVWLQS
ncbi:hypothetical protein JTE90_008205 [Oedothorax gibbosus]|uniref:Uncharacterized protein n=1 Tax=Oedothorax gibbosus TaxID=931172 RepID=A0AAV6TF69_9ARAC|nr:hypothetical protein JTE90_008205 [Oedothorax gibbosus]